MSIDRLRTCLNASVSAGVFSQDKADMMEALARDLEREYREQMSPQLAGAAAVAEAARIMQERALAAKRTMAKQILRQETALEYASRHSRGSGAGAMALMTRDIYEEAPYSNVEARKEVILSGMVSRFADGIDAYHSKAAGLMQDKVGIRNFIRELYGEQTGDTVAATAAKEWQAMTDSSAQRFIDEGGELVMREDYRTPQMHDADRIKKAGFERWRDTIMPLLDKKTWARMEELRRSLASTRNEVDKELAAARQERAGLLVKARDSKGRFESAQGTRKSAAGRLGQLNKQLAEVERELEATQQRAFQAAENRRGYEAVDSVRAASADARAKEADISINRLKTRREELRRQIDDTTAKRADAEARGKSESGQWRAYEEDLRRVEDRLADLERNRSIIENRIDGAPGAINPAHQEEMLRKIYDNIVTRIPPGVRAGDMGVNKRNAHRFFVFKDADSWLTYNDQFGAGQGGIYDLLVGHMDTMARDIALTEIMGPKHAATMQALAEQAAREEGQKPSGFWASLNPMALVDGPKAIVRTYDVLAGRLDGSGATSPGVTFASGIRSMMTAAKLGSAVVSAVPSDTVTLAWASATNGMDVTKVLATALRQMNPASDADRKLALRMNIAGSAVRDAALGTKRFQDEVIGARFPARMADFVIRAQGLAAWTEGTKQAFMIEFLGHVADNASKPLAKVEANLQRTLKRYGVTDAEWDIIRQAQPMDYNGAKVFDPEAVSSRALGEKIMEIAVQERAFAVLEPDARVRQLTTGGTRSDSFVGQMVRSVALFKSFTVTMMMTHMMRAAMQEGLGRKLGYFGAFATLLTLSATISIQTRQIISGKDPRRMDTPEFWGAAIAQGGALGYFGDFLSSATGRDGNTIATAMAGPVLGFFNDAGRLIFPSLRAMYEGEPTRFGAELTRFVNGYAPGSNLWYARLVKERAMMDHLQMLVDPDYRQSFARMERRARQDYDQRYWWGPGDGLPDRAPDLGAMVPD